MHACKCILIDVTKYSYHTQPIDKSKEKTCNMSLPFFLVYNNKILAKLNTLISLRVILKERAAAYILFDIENKRYKISGL